MTRNILIATLFSLGTAILLGIIFIGESRRLPQSDAAIVAERIERGARDYEQYCASCHGLAGQGQVANGAPQLNNITYRYMTPGQDGTAPFEARNGIKEKYGTLRNYIEATLYAGVRGAPMPAFGAQGTLRQDQIENITSYVLSWRTNQNEGNLTDAALLAANLEATRMAPTADPNANPVSQGQIVFTNKGCNGCHNMNDQKSAAQAPGLGGLFQPGGTAAYGEQLPNGRPVNDENVKDWILKGTAPYQNEHIQPQDGETYGVMPGFQITDEEYEALSAWLKAHNRDGTLTEEAQQLQNQTQGGAPRTERTTVPTGVPNNPGAPNSPAGPGSPGTP
ncbi:MAG: c-type cytochrome [Chloroflexota bacterium]|nr:c-type cytochrome [Chloroflexota bacterium]